MEQDNNPASVSGFASNMLPGEVPGGQRPPSISGPTSANPQTGVENLQPESAAQPYTPPTQLSSGTPIPPVQNIYITQQVQSSPGYLVAAQPPKSMAAALLLTFFFGPLGLFYASVLGGIVMLLVSIVVAIGTLGLGLLITVPICMIWAAVATSNYNARFMHSVNQTQINR